MSGKQSTAGGIVLLFVKPVFHSHRERISGVYAAAIERGWQIQQVADPPTARIMGSAVRTWNPIGCLIDPSVMTAGAHSRGRFSRSSVPMVLMGRGEKRLDWNLFDRSFQDCRDPVKTAIAELSRLDVASFAYFEDPDRPHWSVERGEFMREELPAGVKFSSYKGPDPGTLRGRRAAAAWLKSLPLPCGCLLAADHMALPFYAAAAEAQLRIGSDLPVVGVDDDERICRSLKPALTSVKPDFFQSGVNAVALLERRLAHPALPPQSMTYGSLGAVRRASTSPVYSDWRVTKAMAVITDRGCGRLSLADVAAVMKCSTRLAESLFRKHAGTSILDAIRRVRIDKAFTLLRNASVPIDAIPFQCGYTASPSCLKTYFKQVTGLTMREWRRRETRS